MFTRIRLTYTDTEGAERTESFLGRGDYQVVEGRPRRHVLHAEGRTFLWTRAGGGVLRTLDMALVGRNARPVCAAEAHALTGGAA